MIERVTLCVGEWVLIVGGCLFSLILIATLVQIVFKAWISVNNNFRGICKAESMIHEYRIDRDKYIKWKKGQSNGRDAM